MTEAVLDLRSIAAAFGGEVSGGRVRFPSIGHSPADRSAWLKLDSAAPDGFRCGSFTSEDWKALRDHVRGRLGVAPDAWKGRSAPRPQASALPPVSKRRDDGEAAVRFALQLWPQCVHPRGTLVERYLSLRQIGPPDEAGEAIRFLERCRFGDEWLPAMVCLVRDVLTNQPQGIHRTALTSDGHAVKREIHGKIKTYRLSLGRILGGCVKLDSDESVEQGLCLGEGIETCLSGRQMGLRPVWAALCTANIAEFPVLSGVDGLHLFKENDANGASQKAVEQCARRWHAAGRQVIVITPTIGNDLNDAIREGAA